MFYIVHISVKKLLARLYGAFGSSVGIFTHLARVYKSQSNNKLVRSNTIFCDHSFANNGGGQCLQCWIITSFFVVSGLWSYADKGQASVRRLPYVTLIVMLASILRTGIKGFVLLNLVSTHARSCSWSIISCVTCIVKRKHQQFACDSWTTVESLRLFDCGTIYRAFARDKKEDLLSIWNVISLPVPSYLNVLNSGAGELT